MKKILLLFGTILLCQTFVNAQGIVFEKLSFADALAKAKKENKPLFVDLSTVWCAPCIKMEQEVFSKTSVGSFYNANFINLKFDGEKGEGVELVKKFNIKGYPSFLFVGASGDILHRFEGFRNTDELLNEASNAKTAAKYGGWENIKSEYESGRSDAEFLWDYYSVSGKKADVLLRYLKAIPVDELLEQKNAVYFDSEHKPNVPYDYDLYMRVIKELVARNDTTPEYIFSYTFPIQWNISQFFTKVIEQQNDSIFAQLMSLKKAFAPISAGRDTDISLQWGRGYTFASDDYITLSYDASNQINFDTFKPRMEAYMDRLMDAHPGDSIIPEVSRLWGGSVNPPYSPFFMVNLVEHTEYTAKHILMWTDYYWRNLPTTPELKARCSKWTQYAFDINLYNPKTAVPAAQLMVRLGNKRQAVSMLEKTIALRKEAIIENDEQERRKLELVLRDIQNDK